MMPAPAKIPIQKRRGCITFLNKAENEKRKMPNINGQKNAYRYSQKIFFCSGAR